MSPTPRLRFVERKGKPDSFFRNAMTGEAHVPTFTVLQQWFAYDIEYPMTRGEWKDVPLEKEDANQ